MSSATTTTTVVHPDGTTISVTTAPAEEEPAAAAEQPSFKTRMVPLRNGSALPAFGLGTYLSEAGEIDTAVTAAFEEGYILLDTARMYGNEAEIGGAVAKLGRARDSYYVVTKLLPDHHGYDTALVEAEQSLKKLGVEQVDLLLIHNPKGKDCVATWRAMLEVKKRGWAKAVGVSNFGIKQLEGLKAEGLEMPELNQVELHCWLQQKELRAFHEKEGIVTMGYCPLARCKQFGEGCALNAIGEKHGKTAAQVCIRWSLQAGVITIPKSVKPSRIAQNGQAAEGWSLSAEDMAAIDKLDIGFKASGSVNNQDDPWDDVK